MLTKFRLVNTTGLKGVFFKGDFIPFEKIDDTLAEQLLGKTHVLERIPATEAAAPVADVPAAEAPAELPAAAPVAELPAAPAEVGPEDGKKKE